MANVGLSFSPTSDQTNAQSKQQTGSGLSPVQDAIRILSFRVPTVLGASAVSPLVGLGSQPIGGGAPIDSALMQEWLRRLFGGEAGGGFGSAGQPGTGLPPAPSGGAPPPTPPPPSVIVNQPRAVPGPPDQTPPEPMPSPFPGGGGGMGRPY